MKVLRLIVLIIVTAVSFTGLSYSNANANDEVISNLDSIPYLLNCARHGESWAHKAIGDCYLNGKGGLQRSLVNALCYYHLSGIDVEKMSKKLALKNPTDNLSLLYSLLQNLEHFNEEDIASVIISLNANGYHDADIILNLLGNTPPENFSEILVEAIQSPDISADAMVLALITSSLRYWSLESFGTDTKLWIKAGEKVPLIYDEKASELISKQAKGFPCQAELKKSIDCVIYLLQKADENATLSKNNARYLYNHYKFEYLCGNYVADSDNMERLANLADIPESERYNYITK